MGIEVMVFHFQGWEEWEWKAVVDVSKTTVYSKGDHKEQSSAYCKEK
jgi:hypothetical protein